MEKHSILWLHFQHWDTNPILEEALRKSKVKAFSVSFPVYSIGNSSSGDHDLCSPINPLIEVTTKSSRAHLEIILGRIDFLKISTNVALCVTLFIDLIGVLEVEPLGLLRTRHTKVEMQMVPPAIISNQGHQLHC